jgi:nicotinamide-nucleotide amidase
LFDADVTVATTGVAGDETEEGTPPGTVYIATAVGGRAVAMEYRFDGTPVEVCEQARRQALLDLIRALRDTSTS